MPAYIKVGDIKGESTDTDHKDWIIIESMSSSVHRSIPQGAKDAQRAKGETSLGDIVVVRQVDKSSTKFAEACANGAFFKDVQIDLCTTVKGKQEPYLTYKLKDVIITSYGFHGNAGSEPIPTEEVTLGFSEIEWNYVVIDPKDGSKKGNVPASYCPAKGR